MQTVPDLDVIAARIRAALDGWKTEALGSLWPCDIKCFSQKPPSSHELRTEDDDAAVKRTDELLGDLRRYLYHTSCSDRTLLVKKPRDEGKRYRTIAHHTQYSTWGGGLTPERTFNRFIEGNVTLDLEDELPNVMICFPRKEGNDYHSEPLTADARGAIKAGQLEVVGAGDGGSDDKKQAIAALQKDLADIDTEIQKLEAEFVGQDEKEEKYKKHIADDPDMEVVLQGSLKTVQDVTIPAIMTGLAKQRGLRDDKQKEITDAEAAPANAAQAANKKRRPSRDLDNPSKRMNTGSNAHRVMKALKTLQPLVHKENIRFGIDLIRVGGDILERPQVSFEDKLKVKGCMSRAPPTSSRYIEKVKTFLKPLSKTLPRLLGNLVSIAPGEAAGAQYRYYLTDMMVATDELHWLVVAAMHELCDHLGEVAGMGEHSSGHTSGPEVESFLDDEHGYRTFMRSAEHELNLAPVPYSGDHDDEHIKYILKGELDSQYPGIQSWMWGEITKSMLIAVRVSLAMSLLTRSLLITEDRVVDVPGEERVIWTGINPLKEMISLFSMLCMTAPDITKHSTSGVVAFELPEESLDDPFIKGLLQPTPDELKPAPSSTGPRSLQLTCSARATTDGMRCCLTPGRLQLLLYNGTNHVTVVDESSHVMYPDILLAYLNNPLICDTW